MARINPTFYPDTRTWETDDGVSARSVAALKTKLGRGATIANYYPNGYGLIIRERPKSESIFQQSVDEAVAKVARRHEAKTLALADDIEPRLDPVYLPEDIKVVTELPPEGKVETIPSHPIEIIVEGGTVEEVAQAIAPKPQPDAPLAPEPVIEEEVLVEPIDVPAFLPGVNLSEVEDKALEPKKRPKRDRPKRKPTWVNDKRKLQSFTFPKVDWKTQLPVMLKMFQEGKSIKEIAGVIHCSENSVIGKLHRLGFTISKR